MVNSGQSIGSSNIYFSPYSRHNLAIVLPLQFLLREGERIVPSSRYMDILNLASRHLRIIAALVLH